MNDIGKTTFELTEYRSEHLPELLLFLEKCLPESGRTLDTSGRHAYYLDIPAHFSGFWCLFADGKLIGTVAVAKLDDNNCELKSLYLYESFQGRGFGRSLLERAVSFASESGYEHMYLDTFSTSERAVKLYRRAGFRDTQKYRSSLRSDVFMILDLKGGNSMNDFIKTMEERRSCRAFKSELPPKELIEKVCEAGTYAATGMNRQSPIIIAVTNKELRDRLSAMNSAVMGKSADFDPFYGAPAVLIVLADRNIPTHVYDGSLVMGNLMNAAHALGLASCWIHRAREEFDSDEGKEILRSLGIEGDYEGIGHCVLGYAQNEAAPAMPRKTGYVYFAE
ncbi:MAG: GNAT family N-acetyltransferase [Ruminococcus sp.]|nr:GNAT family N-acetyltransferase [Ruminococcus sp.]